MIHGGLRVDVPEIFIRPRAFTVVKPSRVYWVGRAKKELIPFLNRDLIDTPTALSAFFFFDDNCKTYPRAHSRHDPQLFKGVLYILP